MNDDVATADTTPPECLPPCHCATSTPWASRRRDGEWDEDPEGCVLEQRTCVQCGASMTREVQHGVAADILMGFSPKGEVQR